MNVGDFLRLFKIKNGYYLVTPENPDKGNFHFVKGIDSNGDSDKELFFTPSQFRIKKNSKESVLGTNFLWVDVDSLDYPNVVLPPTFVVFSGHGYHLYYRLEEPILDYELIESLNKLLIEHTPNSDKGTFNANRFLRVPQSLNRKEEPYERVAIKAFYPFVYRVEDIQVLRKLTKKTKHKILTGDSRGYTSRSELDYAVIMALVKAGATDNLIEQLFNFHPVGKKAVEAHESYLPRTINKVRANLPTTDEHTPDERGIVAEIDGYYYLGKTTKTQISTFTIEPLLLIKSTDINTHDSLLCNIHCLGTVTEGVVFTKQAFTSIRNLDKECLNINWSWLGTESQLRKLLPHILEELATKNTPTTLGIPYTGIYNLNGIHYFVGTDRVLTASTEYQLLEAPVTFINNRVNNYTDLSGGCGSAEIAKLGEILPTLNKPNVIWVFIGWYTLSLLKPHLEALELRLPILSVTGTKGSGKTTLIKLFMKLIGQTKPKLYDSGTTRFVTLTLLASSYSLPVAFSEFRYEAVEHFLRFILLAYDTGVDSRGNANQTITEYPLRSPFTLDGEDMLFDSAVKERIVTAKLSATTVLEGTKYYEAFKQFSLPANFAKGFIKYLLKLADEDKVRGIIKEAETELFKEYPANMPERIRSNHTLLLAGCFIFSDYVGIDRPPTKVVGKSLATVFNLETERATLLVDSFIEDIVNLVSTDSGNFKWDVSEEGTVFYFQLGTAYPIWLTKRRSRGKTTSLLERQAIRSQLEEVPYYLGSEVKNDILMYKISLKKAYEVGLDIPAKLTKSNISIQWVN